MLDLRTFDTDFIAFKRLRTGGKTHVWRQGNGGMCICGRYHIADSRLEDTHSSDVCLSCGWYNVGRLRRIQDERATLAVGST